MPRESRTEPRYFAITPIPAEIDGNNADLVDISTMGARVQTTRNLSVGQEVSFVLQTPDATIVTPGTVVWCEVAALAMQDEEFDRYLCGLSFAKSVSLVRTFIEHFLAARMLILIEETRDSERYRVMAPLTASFSSHLSLRVLDLSIRGARLSTPERIEPGTSATLQFTIGGVATPVKLPATVVWSRAAERKGRFECGLCISDAEAWLRCVIDELALRDGVVIETDSLRRKFDPFTVKRISGVVSIHR